MINLEPKRHTRKFKHLNEVFEDWYKAWNPIQNNFRIEEYLGDGLGVAKGLKKLKNEGLCDLDKDFKGIYVLQKLGKPFYVGISKHVIKRIIQHVKGKNHFTSSLSYSLGAQSHIEKHGKSHEGGREGLDFEEYAEPEKRELLRCDVSIFPVENDLELYLFEVFMAMKLKTLRYNKFQTH